MELKELARVIESDVARPLPRRPDFQLATPETLFILNTLDATATVLLPLNSGLGPAKE